MILLVILCGISLLLACFYGYLAFSRKREVERLSLLVDEYLQALIAAQKAIDLAIKYEDFYEATVGDVSLVVDQMNALLTKRQVLSDDPEIQSFVRLIAITHDILLGYINAKLPEADPQNKNESNS